MHLLSSPVPKRDASPHKVELRITEYGSVFSALHWERPRIT
jgi:hypothetical protein